MTQETLSARLKTARANLAALVLTASLTGPQLAELDLIITDLGAAVLVVVAPDPPPLPAQTTGVQGRQTSTMGAWTTLP